GLEQDHADFQISTVFDNGRLLVRRRQRASDPSTAAECSLVRVPGAYSATRCSTGRTASHCPLSELHPDRDSTCLDCGDIEEYHLLRRELYARTTKRRYAGFGLQTTTGAAVRSFQRGDVFAAPNGAKVITLIHPDTLHRNHCTKSAFHFTGETHHGSRRRRRGGLQFLGRRELGEGFGGQQCKAFQQQEGKKIQGQRLRERIRLNQSDASP
ncbi:unnamed protein product, partial [Ixodes persulcatus]